MNGLGRILLVEDDPKDIDLTLAALGEYNLANEVIVVRDGAEARLPPHEGQLQVARQGEPCRGAARPEAAESRRFRSPAGDPVRRKAEATSPSSCSPPPARIGTWWRVTSSG